MDLDLKIKAMETVVDEHQECLNKSEKALYALYLERAKRDYGVSAGCTVWDLCRDKKFIVSEIQWFGSRRGKPWLEGYVVKKDGTPGKVEQYIGTDWEVKK
jgi:hypothetical protein